MKRFVIGAVLMCGVVATYAVITGVATIPMPVAQPHPGLVYRHLTWESQHQADYINICGNPGEVTEDLDAGEILWGDTCNTASFRIQAWNANNTYIWLENSNQDSNNPVDAYSSRPLVRNSDYQVKHGKCEEYNDGDSRWHPSFANYRINVVQTSGDWILEWYDVVNCNAIKSEVLLTDSDPNTFSGGILDNLGWSTVHHLSNFEGNIDATGRYVAINGRDPHNGGDPASSSRANEMVVIDMGVTTSDAMSVSNVVDLCAYNDWVLVDPTGADAFETDLNPDANGVLACPGIGTSSGSTAMSPDAEYVVVRYGSISGVSFGDYTRVFDYNPSNETISVKDLKGGGSEECACANGGACLNGKRSKGFGPISDHADVTMKGSDPVVVGTRRSACDGPTGWNQDEQFSLVLWKVADGTLYPSLVEMSAFTGESPATARHASGVGKEGWVYGSFFDSTTADPNINKPYDFECAAFSMSNVDPNDTTDLVERYVHHRDNAESGSFDDEDEAQCNARPDGLRQIFRTKGSPTGTRVTTVVVKDGSVGGGGSGGGAGNCGNCYGCICVE